MKNLSLKQAIHFCDKYVISYDELVLLEIILLAQDGESPEIINDYFRSRARGSTIELLTKLRDAGIILKTYKIPQKGEKLDLYSILLNKNITKDFYRSSFEMGQELWDAYPQFGIINNSPVPLKAVAKRFDSIEDSFSYYARQIRNKPDIHKEIVELVKWANENQILCCSFSTFIIDHKWDDLKALKNGDGSNVNYNAMKLL